MFKHLLEENELQPVMEEHGLVLPDDLLFIEEQIAGPLDADAAQGHKVLSSVLKQSWSDFQMFSGLYEVVFYRGASSLPS